MWVTEVIPGENVNVQRNRSKSTCRKLAVRCSTELTLHIEVPAVPYKELASGKHGTNSEVMRAQVVAAREIQANRFPAGSTTCNGGMSSNQVRQFCQVENQAHGLLRQMVSDLGLSARAYDKVLRVARTIADLEAAEPITSVHVQEAINYRILDRQYW